MRVVIIGAGVAGLGAALALSRSDHEIVLLERDDTPTPADADEAFDWNRRGAPQVRHSHAFLARLRNLLRDQHPELLANLIEAGATEIDFCAMLPPEIIDRAPRPGDEDLVALACRRTTFEWVLRRTVTRAGRVDLVDGASVSALLAATKSSDLNGIPQIIGVECADGRRFEADIVLAAGGRQPDLEAWLYPLDVKVESQEEDTGIIYFSRFYVLDEGVAPPDTTGPIGGDLGYLKYAVFQGDNRTFSITFAIPTDDAQLRRQLLRPDDFDTIAARLPATAPWVAPNLARPLTEVNVMARLLNRQRRFLDADGRPVVLGFHAVGDAHTCTNPLYGRGCSLALVQAHLVADAIAQHTDPVERSVAYEAATAEEIEPWYHASVMSDRQGRLIVEKAKRERRGEDTTEVDAAPEAFGADILRNGVLPAVRTDPHVFRAFLRGFNLLDTPEALFSDPVTMAVVMQTYQDRDQRPPEEPLGPRRSELLAGSSPMG